MRKVLVVAVREYRAAVRTKSFLISVLLMPVLMFGGAGAQVILQRQSDTEDRTFAVIDRTPGHKIFDALNEAVDKRNKSRQADPETGHKPRGRFLLERIPPSVDDLQAIREQRLELSEQVRAEKYWGFLDIGRDVVTPMSAAQRPTSAREDDSKTDEHRTIRYQTNHPTYEAFPTWAQMPLVLAISKARLPPWVKWFQGQQRGDEALERASRELAIRREGLSERNPKNNQIEDPPLVHQIARFLVPAGLVALMFMMIMLSSTPAMQGVVEEKMQRIAEVLLGSLTPFQLMLGKLIGIMSVSLTVAAVYLIGLYAAAARYGFTEFLPAPIIAWFIVFQALAVLMYGSIYLAIGAAATDVKETQTLVIPVVLVVCIPMMILRNAIEDPNSALVTAASFFPPTTPMLMMARVSIPPGPAWWQPYLSVIVGLAATLACVYASGRIFRVGLLVQGKGARLGQLVQWVFRG